MQIAHKKAAKKKRAARAVPQEAEVVDRNEYHLRILQSKEIEVFVFAENPSTAQELANNGLGRVISETLIVSETKSISQIG